MTCPRSRIESTSAPNGGTGAPSDTTKYAANATVTIKTSPVPSKANCSFTGYVLSTTAPAPHAPTPPNTYSYSGGAFTPASFKITDNATLTAQFDCTQHFTVAYNGNGGGLVPTDATSYATGATVNLIATPIPTKAGCTFAGYLGNVDDDTDSNDGSDQGPNGANTLFTYSGGKFTPANFKINENVTLTAQWGCFTVTYGGGNPVDPNFYSQGAGIETRAAHKTAGHRLGGYGIGVRCSQLCSRQVG